MVMSLRALVIETTSADVSVTATMAGSARRSLAEAAHGMHLQPTMRFQHVMFVGHTGPRRHIRRERHAEAIK